MNTTGRRIALGLVCAATLATLTVSGEAASPRPSLNWSRFVSGSVTANTDAVVASDSAGHVYVAGQWGRPATSSGGLVALPGVDSRAPGHDLFVGQFDGTGKVLWLRTLGGSHSVEFVRDLTVLSAWLAARGPDWRDTIDVAVLDPTPWVVRPAAACRPNRR